MNKLSRRTVLQAAALAPALGTPLLHAQGAPAAAWPTRTVRIVVGFPGGSTPDMSARALAEPLAKVLGQPVVVDNKPGASGNIAATQVAQATDDHTLGVVINGNLTSAKMLYSKLPYDPDRDFTDLSLLATAPLALVAPAGLPGGTAFFTAAREQGNKWNYGSVGPGSLAHLGMELLKSKVPGLLPVHVSYRGNPDVLTAMIGGQIQMALVPPGLVLQHIKSGQLQAIGLAGGRSPLAPEIAPLADAGVRDFELEVWNALVGPATLSKAARERLADEVPRIIRSAETRQRLFTQGWQAVGSSPEGMTQRVKREAAIMGQIIRDTGTKLE